MATTRRQKPRLSAPSYALLVRIADYIVRYDLRGSELPGAAPDVLDGLVSRLEIDELVRKKILSIVRVSPTIFLRNRFLSASAGDRGLQC